MKELKTSLRAPQPSGSYSQGIRWDNLLFTAGMGPTDPSTGRISGNSIEEQTEQVLLNLQALLEDQGLTLNDVLKATVHLSDLNDFTGFDRVYRRFFSPPYPVRTTVGSQLMGILVEIDFVCAYKSMNT